MTLRTEMLGNGRLGAGKAPTPDRGSYSLLQAKPKMHRLNFLSLRSKSNFHHPLNRQEMQQSQGRRGQGRKKRKNIKCQPTRHAQNGPTVPSQDPTSLILKCVSTVEMKKCGSLSVLSPQKAPEEHSELLAWMISLQDLQVDTPCFALCPASSLGFSSKAKSKVSVQELSTPLELLSLECCGDLAWKSAL